MTNSGRQPQFKRRAQVDLVEIWVYLAQRNLTAADRVLARLHERCDTLANSPGFGSMHPDIRPDLLVSPCEGYAIIYRMMDDTIEVIRIVHGSRDWPTLLRDEE